MAHRKWKEIKQQPGTADPGNMLVYGQSSHGVATPIRDTPRDDLSIRKSNVTMHERSEFV